MLPRSHTVSIFSSLSFRRTCSSSLFTERHTYFISRCHLRASTPSPGSVGKCPTRKPDCSSASGTFQAVPAKVGKSTHYQRRAKASKPTAREPAFRSVSSPALPPPIRDVVLALSPHWMHLEIETGHVRKLLFTLSYL